ncbi:hypothetical protein EV360DRAFT_78774 [Lentinula raphanica]|nr:hypothetical protein EV360DRAFT_78774 [Lentinula raphanica]
MFHSALQSILTIVLPKPSFRVTPSQPDSIYYTATVFRAYNHPKSSFSNFNVSMTKVDGTPRLVFAASGLALIEFQRVAAHAAVPMIYRTASHTDSWNSSLFSRIPKLSDMPFASQDFQEPLPPNKKRLRRTRKRITSSSSANGLDHTAAPGSFDTANEFQSGVESLQNLDTAKRTSTHELDLSVSDSCSSFDASDHDGTYSSIPMHLSSPVSLSSRPQNRISQAHSDMFPPAFELSPIMESSCTFEEMDDILALYSDSPILGHMNESHASSEFAFDDADWEQEPIFDTADECEIDTADAESVVTDPKRVRPRQLSYALKAVDSEDVFLSAGTHGHTQSDTHADLLSPPSLTLTFPTPVMEDASTFPEPIPLANASDQSLTFPSIPRTPPCRSQSHNVLLEPPTPMPPLPRCTSCGFGFSFDVTGSTDMIHRPVNPCDQCQAQWDRCRKWYGKRGWQVERTEDTSSQDTEIKKEKTLKRVSRRFSQIVEGVFTTDRESQRSSIDPSARGATSTSKRSSIRLSWRYRKQRMDFDKTQDDLSRIQNGGHGSSQLNENGTRVRDYALFPNVGLEPTDLQPSPSNTGGASNSTKSNLPRPLSFFGTQVTNSDELPKKRRRSFSVFGLSRTLSLRRHQVI